MEFGEKLVLIASEAFAGMKIHVEAADEGFVVAAEAGNDGGQAGFDLLGVLGLEVVVEENHDGGRKSFGGEKFQALLDVVVEDGDFAGGKSGNEGTGAVFYGE